MLFPGTATQGRTDAKLPSDLDGEVVELTTARRDKIVAWFADAIEPSPSSLTMILFYGNGMCLAHTIDLLDAFRAIGLNVVGVEYPGYGLSSGEPGEAAFYAAADAAYDETLRRGVRPARIISAGISLGTAVAVDLASRKRVGGVALFSPFTNMDALAKRVVPWLPTRKLLEHHFRSDAKIGSLACPILIVHGTRDTLIPIAMAGELAAKATNAEVEFIELAAGHNDLFLKAEKQITAGLRRLIARMT